MGTTTPSVSGTKGRQSVQHSLANPAYEALWSIRRGRQRDGYRYVVRIACPATVEWEKDVNDAEVDGQCDQRRNEECLLLLAGSLPSQLQEGDTNLPDRRTSHERLGRGGLVVKVRRWRVRT